MRLHRAHQACCLVLSLSLVWLLSACGDKNALGPNIYNIEYENAPSLNAALDGQGGFLDSTEVQDNKNAPSDTEDGPDGEQAGNTDENQDAVEVPTQMLIYRYRDMPDKGATVEAYVDALIDADIGFLLVDSSGQQAKKPDFTAEEGSLILYRANLERRTNFCIQLEWKSSELTVSVYIAANTVGVPSASGSGRQMSDPNKTGLTAETAVSYLKSLPPAMLDLPGKNMTEYNVYYTEGKAVVDGNACIRLRLYGVDQPEGSNAFLATYFLSADKSHLYRMDDASGEMIELPLPNL